MAGEAANLFLLKFYIFFAPHATLISTFPVLRTDGSSGPVTPSFANSLRLLTIHHILEGGRNQKSMEVLLLRPSLGSGLSQ